MPAHVRSLRLRSGDDTRLLAIVQRRRDRVARRAQILLKRAAGQSQRHVAQELSVHRRTVILAETKYREEGLRGVFDRRSERPRLREWTQNGAEVKKFVSRAIKNLWPRDEIISHLVSNLKETVAEDYNLDELAQAAGLPVDYCGVRIYYAGSTKQPNESGDRLRVVPVPQDADHLQRRSSGNGKVYWCTSDRRLSIAECKIKQALARVFGPTAEKVWSDNIGYITVRLYPPQSRNRVERMRNNIFRGLKHANREKDNAERLVLYGEGDQRVVERRLERAKERIHFLRSLNHLFEQPKILMNPPMPGAWIEVRFSWNAQRTDHKKLREVLEHKINSERQVLHKNGLGSTVDRLCLPIKVNYRGS